MVVFAVSVVMLPLCYPWRIHLYFLLPVAVVHFRVSSLGCRVVAAIFFRTISHSHAISIGFGEAILAESLLLWD